jgi:hypothetical protein
VGTETDFNEALKGRLMLRVIFTIAVAGCLAHPAFAEDVPSQFRGYTEINRILKERMIRRSGFELGRYVGEALAEPNSNSLVALLGTFQGTDTDGEFRNGDPNAFNMTLWYVLLNRFAMDVGQVCKNKNQLPLLPQFAATLKPLCSWPDASAKSETVLETFWTAVTDYEFPDDEYDAWKAFIVDTYATKSAPDAISAMTLSILYNPYFLLKD